MDQTYVADEPCLANTVLAQEHDLGFGIEYNFCEEGGLVIAVAFHHEMGKPTSCLELSFSWHLTLFIH